MTQLCSFSPDIFESADALRTYLTGQEAISQIHLAAESPIPPVGAKLDGKWEVVIHKQPQESGICQGGALNLKQAKPMPKQLNLNKLGDAGSFQIQRLPTQAETDS